jgi:hypothetical protein
VRHWCHNTLTFSRQKTRNRKDKNNKNNANIFSSSIYEKYTLQRQNAENLKQIFPEKEYRGLSPNFQIHVSVSELYILTMGLPFLLEEICGPILGIYKSLTGHINVESGAEATQFPEKEYINGIAVVV